jgi:hypothetical protein
MTGGTVQGITALPNGADAQKARRGRGRKCIPLLPVRLIPVALVPAELRASGSTTAVSTASTLAAGGETQGQEYKNKESEESVFLHGGSFQKATLLSNDPAMFGLSSDAARLSPMPC